MNWNTIKKNPAVHTAAGIISANLIMNIPNLFPEYMPKGSLGQDIFVFSVSLIGGILILEGIHIQRVNHVSRQIKRFESRIESFLDEVVSNPPQTDGGTADNRTHQTSPLGVFGGALIGAALGSFGGPVGIAVGSTIGACAGYLIERYSIPTKEDEWETFEEISTQESEPSDFEQHRDDSTNEEIENDQTAEFESGFELGVEKQQELGARSSYRTRRKRALNRPSLEVYRDTLEEHKSLLDTIEFEGTIEDEFQGTLEEYTELMEGYQDALEEYKHTVVKFDELHDLLAEHEDILRTYTSAIIHTEDSDLDDLEDIEIEVSPKDEGIPSVGDPPSLDPTAINDLNETHATRLREAGFDSIEALADANAEDIAEAAGVYPERAEKWIQTAQDHQE